MIATCHIYSTATNGCMFSVPCASAEWAREVAKIQQLSIIQTDDFTAGYRHGTMLFCTNKSHEIQHWLDMLKLKLPTDVIERIDWHQTEAEIKAENERLARKHVKWLEDYKKQIAKLEKRDES